MDLVYVPKSASTDRIINCIRFCLFLIFILSEYFLLAHQIALQYLLYATSLILFPAELCYEVAVL